MDESRRYVEQMKPDTKKIHATCFQLNETLVKAKLENRLFLFWDLVCGEILMAEEHYGIFWDDENYLYFNWNDNYVTLVYVKTVQLK